MLQVPDHDVLVARIQEDVCKAVDKIGWSNVSASCFGHHISMTVVKKIYTWRPHRPGSGDRFESFNLAKLLDAHSWALDILDGRVIEGSSWRG
jgi:hypothetical protein